MLVLIIRQGRVYKSIVLILTITLFSYSLAGCAGMSSKTKATLACGLVGGLVGAAAGAAIDKDNRGRGAAIGAAIGAVAAMGACFAIASYQNREVADYQRTSQQVNYQPSSGDMVKISQFSVSPSAVRPGEKVAFNAEYYVMTPDPDKEITVTETRTIKAYDQSSGTYNELGSSTNQVTMKPGTRRGDGVINVNGMTPQGNYVLALAVEHDGKKAEMERPLVISSNPSQVSNVSQGTKEAVSSEPTTQSDKVNQYFVVSVDTANLRSGAGTKFNIFGQLRNGERYPVLETIRNSGENYPWYRIRLDDGREGWVNGASGKIE